jgi:Protein of unknown function (DUF3370)
MGHTRTRASLVALVLVAASGVARAQFGGDSFSSGDAPPPPVGTDSFSSGDYYGPGGRGGDQFSAGGRRSRCPTHGGILFTNARALELYRMTGGQIWQYPCAWCPDDLVVCWPKPGWERYLTATERHAPPPWQQQQQAPPPRMPPPRDPWLPPAYGDSPACADPRYHLRDVHAADLIDGGFLRGPRQKEMLDSNHPEIVRDLGGGILVSTLAPAAGVRDPSAHLGHAFRGGFRIFASHINGTGRPAYQSIVLHNPTNAPVGVRIDAMAAADSKAFGYDDLAGVFFNHQPAHAGPGAEVARQLLESRAPRERVLAPGETVVLHSAPAGRGVNVVQQAELNASGPVEAAVLYTEARLDGAGAAAVLRSGGLVRDTVPKPGPGQYGTVSGVVGSSSYWGALTNDREHARFVVVGAPCTRRFVLDAKGTPVHDLVGDDAQPVTVPNHNNTAPTNAGNYGAEVQLDIPLYNPTDAPVQARIFLDTPPDAGAAGHRVIRNPIELTLDGKRTVAFVDQTQGVVSQQPLFAGTLQPGEQRHAGMHFFHAANNTPPYVLRIETRPAAR